MFKYIEPHAHLEMRSVCRETYSTVKEVIDLRANAHAMHSGKRKNFIVAIMNPLLEC